MQRRPETSATGKFSSVMIPDDANILSAVKKCYNRKSCFRASVDVENVSRSTFCVLIHCPDMAVQQELLSCLTRFGWQFNKNRKTIQQESAGNSCCFARCRFRNIMDCCIAWQCKPMTINMLYCHTEKCSKQSKE